MRLDAPLESVLKRDRAVVLAGILCVAGLAWGYMVYLAFSMGGMDAGMAMVRWQAWTAADFGLMFLMWAVMMTAMMVPTAAPMLLLFATVNRQRREKQQPYVPTGVFLSGYVLVWCGFAAGATVASWALHVNSLLTSMMGASASVYMAGGLLIAAGAFQWSRLKYVCLTHCRSPLSFLMTDWREGPGGHWPWGCATVSTVWAAAGS